MRVEVRAEVRARVRAKVEWRVVRVRVSSGERRTVQCGVAVAVAVAVRR